VFFEKATFEIVVFFEKATLDYFSRDRAHPLAHPFSRGATKGEVIPKVS